MGFAKKAAKNLTQSYRQYRDNKTRCDGCGITKRMGGGNVCSTDCGQRIGAALPSIDDMKS